MIMTTRFIIVATIATFAIPSAKGQPTNDLVGKWTSLTQEGGARTETSVEFFANRTYAHRMVIISEFGWTQQGNFLLLAPVIAMKNGEPQYGRASALQMKLDGDELTISDKEQTIAM
jgi:hypothetical protein